MKLFQQVCRWVNYRTSIAVVALACSACADQTSQSADTVKSAPALPITAEVKATSERNTTVNPQGAEPAEPRARDTDVKGPHATVKKRELEAQPEKIMTVSRKAAERLLKMRDTNQLKHETVYRISVLEGNFYRIKGGGEKRYRYHLVLDDDPRGTKDDFSMESEGLTILVPKSCAHLLRGTEMIWIEAGGKGGFKFQNPNEIHDDDEEAAKQQIIPIPEPKGSPAKPQAGPTPIDE